MYLLKAHQPAGGANFSERASPTAELHVPLYTLYLMKSELRILVKSFTQSSTVYFVVIAFL